MTDVIARRYIKKPEAVEAIQLTSKNINFLANWCDGNIIRRLKPVDPNNEYFRLDIPTPLGTVRAYSGDYITKTLYGEFNKVSADRFEREYQNEGMTSKLRRLEQAWNDRAQRHG